AEISYAIASGHGDTDVQLDQLQVGPNSVATTDAQGAYWLSWLPPAEYRLQTVAQSNWSATAPSGGINTVVLTAGQASGQIDFGQQAAPGSPWQNQTNPNDVNKDLALTPLDALIVINDLNVNGARQLPNPPAEGEGPPPFPDVNGDGYLTPSDALGVINALNLICCSGEGAGEGESAGADQGSQAGSSAEGEAAWLWAQPGHGPWNQSPTSSRPVATEVGDPLANADHDVALVAASFELAVHQQAAKVSHKPSSGQWADQESAMDPLLESVGPDSALEAVFFGLGLGCTL
ncbi:MAG: dockerin type I domain-containing protein, partial [Pirellulaceae bacterium]